MAAVKANILLLSLPKYTICFVVCCEILSTKWWFDFVHLSTWQWCQRERIALSYKVIVLIFVWWNYSMMTWRLKGKFQFFNHAMLLTSCTLLAHILNGNISYCFVWHFLVAVAGTTYLTQIDWQVNNMLTCWKLSHGVGRHSEKPNPLGVSQNIETSN